MNEWSTEMPVIGGLTSDEIKNNTNQNTKEISNSNSNSVVFVWRLITRIQKHCK